MSLFFNGLFYKLMLPGNTEYAIRIFENQSNLAMTGVFMSINFHKKIVWFSLFIGSILIYFNFSSIGLLFFTFALTKYYLIVDKYKCVIVDYLQ